MSYDWIGTRLDFVLAALTAACIAAYAARCVRRAGSANRLSLSSWQTCAIVLLSGGLAAEWLRTVPLAGALVLAASLTFVAVFLGRKTRPQALREAKVERDQMLLELQRSKDAAEVASRAKTEFIAIMSHEIRTPLTAVVGFANVLSETRLTATQRRYVDTIANAGDRLTNLLNNILDFTKIEEGKMTLERVPFSPALIVHEVIDLLSANAQTKGLELHFDNQLGNALTLDGDPTRVRQVLMNLVANAVKFTERGRITVSGEWQPAGSQSGPGTLRIAVSDSGIGIPPEKLPTLFQMFTQAEPGTTRRFGGTGLGLAICKRLVEMMGGTIGVTSNPAQGSTFHFSIPAALAPMPVNASQTPTAFSAHPFQPERRVLVVDDHELNRELLRLLLRRCGYEADVAASGPEALHMAERHTYFAIFMDLDMPVTDGFTATAQIRRSERADRHVPIIAVTAVTLKGTREKCLAAGMDEYLSKPVYVPALQSTLEALIERRQLPRGESASHLKIGV